MAKAKRKTTIMLDPELWVEFVNFVTKKHGSARKTSEEIENAMRDYLKKFREATES
jgi:metal-responsive CopG/Arc/MetJ family transcriptional regulator